MISPFDLLLLFGAVMCAAFFSGIETASYAVSRIRLKYKADDDNRTAVRALSLLSNHPALVVATLVGTNVAVYLSGKAALGLTSAIYSDRLAAELYSTLWLTPLIFVFAEIAPKWWFRRSADSWFPLSCRVLAVSRALFAPAVWLLLGLVWFLRKLLPMRAEEAVSLGKFLERAFSRQGIHEYIRDVAVEKGLIKPAQQQVLDVVLRRFRRPVCEMAQGVAFQALIPPDATVRRAVEAAASRDEVSVLVGGVGGVGGGVSQLSGAVYIYDITGKPAGDSISSFVKELPEFAPESPVEKVLEELRRAQRSVALIVEDGETIGVVSMTGIMDFLLHGGPGHA